MRWFFIALVIISLLSYVLGEFYLSEKQYDALKDLYDSTQGENWTWSEPYNEYGYPWDFSNNLSDPCNTTYPWQGITCNYPCSEYLCNIIMINLVNKGLNGTIPNSIGDFEWLSTLNFNFNYLTGSLPATIGKLENIQSFQIMSNELTGSITDNLHNLTLFSMLFLDDNYLTSLIPSSLFTLPSLYYLSLQNNFFSGEFPPVISNTSNMIYLMLNDNLLSGTLPHSIGNMRKLGNLNLYDNVFTGFLPDSIGNWTKLTSLQAQQNFFSGSIPSTIGNLSQVFSLLLYSNLITGSIPHEITQLINLREIYFSLNYLSGSIPSSIENMKDLNAIFLNSNLLTDEIPADNLSNIPSLTILMLFENQFIGTISDSFAKFPMLAFLMINNNELTGTIPSSLGNLSTLVELVIYSNKISGTIPKELSQATQLSYFLAYDNLLTGPIPNEMGDMMYLENLYLFDNYLTGTIPNSFNNLTYLFSFDLENNLLTGTIPNKILTFFQLTYCYLASNQFTGELSFEYANDTSKLEQLVVFNNLFSGSFPIHNINNFTNSLFIIDVSSNYFTGSIPLDIINNVYLKYISLGSNYFTGNIPDNLFTLNDLTFFNGQKNYFTDSLPAQCSTTNHSLKYYDASSNLLSGPIPITYSDCFDNLIYINLANNYLSGTLASLIFPSIQVIYLQNNTFTGSIPDEILLGGNIQIFMSSLNCLSGSLPEAFCQNYNLSQLFLDGLHSSSGCINSIFPFDSYSSYAINNGVQGTIPTCLFQIPSLEILHISGNDLHGPIPITINEISNLTSLILSNNLLTGNIPSFLLESDKIVYLDLSFNWFSTFTEGDSSVQEHFFENKFYNVSSVIQPGLRLQDNHLSGRIPSKWTKNISDNLEINLLEGNMFSCDSSRDDLPHQDPNKVSYQCGSDYTNTSLYISLALLCITLIYFLYCFGIQLIISLLPVVYNLGDKTNNLLSNLMKEHQVRFSYFKSKDALNYLKQVSFIYTTLGRVLYLLLLWVLLCIVPLYVIFSMSLGTYKHQYVWILSSAYLSGSTAAIVLLCFFLFTVISIVGYLFPFFKTFPILSQTFFVCSKSITSQEQSWNKELIYTQVKVFFVLLLEVFIVLLVNFSYILAINRGYNNTIMIFISLAISAFKIFWGNLMLLGKGRLYLENLLQIKLPIGWVIFLSIFNNLIAPYLAEAFVSPNCFLYAITKPPSVDTVYYEVQCFPSYQCLIGEGFGTSDTYCYFEVTCDDILSSHPQSSSTLSYSPPFHYNFTCSSSLLAAFVYIFIYRYLFTGIVEPLFYGLIKFYQRYADIIFHRFHIQALTFGKIDSPQRFIQMLTGFLPILMKFQSFIQEQKERSKDAEEEENKTLLLLQEFEEITLDETINAIERNVSVGERSLVRLITDMMMILSFGVLFPPLGILIFICLVKDIMLEQYFLCQYIDSMMFTSTLDKRNNLKKISQVLYILNDQFSTWISFIWPSIWWIILVSVCFWSFSLYDTLGSQNGAIQSLWIIFIMALSPYWTMFLINSFLYILNSSANWFVRQPSNQLKSQEENNNLSVCERDINEYHETELASPKPSDLKQSDLTSFDVSSIYNHQNQDDNLDVSTKDPIIIDIENPLQKT